MEYLDFELPIKRLEDQLENVSLLVENQMLMFTNTCKQIQKQKKLIDTKRLFIKFDSMATCTIVRDIQAGPIH
jgi:acetyl-CoA carboxylase carboxyl transferase subunit alpha